MVFVTVVTCVTVSFRFGTQRFALDSSLSAGLSVPLAQLGRGAEQDSTPGTSCASTGRRAGCRLF